MIKGGVVADDITGANDIGSMFAKGRYLVHVYASEGVDRMQSFIADKQPDVSIVDTNSRLDTPAVAYDKVFTATHRLRQTGCRRFFNKTCSVFRGNIGVEFDAMLDALDEEFAVVVLGFPKNGRLTIDGVHYVHGVRLQDSPFRDDPIHPATESNLVDILQAQTRRRVGLLNHQVIAEGADVLRARVAALRSSCNYVILDVPDQASLTTIARAVGDCRVLCGSSALAEELPRVWGAGHERANQDELPPADITGILCAAGSLTPQTRAQIQYMKGHGFPTVELDTLALFTPGGQAAEIERIVAFAVQYLATGRDVLVYAAGEPAIVEQTQAEGTRRGLTRAEVGRMVEDTLAKVVARALDASEGRRLVVAGGETSAAISRELGVQGLRIWKEIQPGLPSCVSLTVPPLLMVLKSGSFGSADFLVQALDHLRAQ